MRPEMCSCGHPREAHRFARNYSECGGSDFRALPGTFHVGADRAPTMLTCTCSYYAPAREGEDE